MSSHRLIPSMPTARRLTAGALLCVMVVCGATAAMAAYTPKSYPQPKKSTEPDPPVVIRFTAAQRARYYGSDVLVVTGVGALDGKPVQMAIHNSDEKAGKYDPRPEQASVANALKPGDYAKAEIERKDQQVWVKKLEAYKATPGEEEPNTFLFDESYTKGEKGAEQLMVRMTKFAHYVEATVPQKRNEAKEMVPDPAVAEKVAAFKKGDLVEAELRAEGQTSYLASVDIYKEAEQAKFQKLGDSEVDGQKYPTVDLDQDGKPLSLPLAGKVAGKKMTADSRLVAAVRSIKAGTEVLFRTHEEGGKTYLKEIHAAPRPVGAKPDAGRPDPKMEAKPDAKVKGK